ncbi:hypothetical protein O6H91_07G081800 [Diphasiastrum complanatum]|nr:hypothetical protein O6H91_07G081800 [Diphasiastrum complanatum]
MEITGRFFLSGRHCFLLLISLILGWVLLFFHFLVLVTPRGEGLPSTSFLSSKNSVLFPFFHLSDFSPAKKRLWQHLKRFDSPNDACAGKYIYMHDIPKEFNQDMLDHCQNLNLWRNMCEYTINTGLGPLLKDSEGSFSESGWFGTNQFSVELIFHNRMKQYRCLTNDSSKAIAFFVPFYAGLDVSRYLWGGNTTIRDSASLAITAWLRNQPEWKVMGGRDHFMVAGRITWDFRRQTDEQSDWGNKLLLLPEVKNMTVLVIEASPWHHNDFAIPYPTYFHPSKDSEILEWQERMNSAKRTVLFSFAGAPRPEIETSIRGQIMEQCKRSIHCKLLECDLGASKCDVPSVVMKLFEESVFCLQPQGDSFTRRSIFDSILAGCIPVFFHQHSAYSQYTWHLLSSHSKYSVYICEEDIRTRKVSIENVLLQISPEKVQSMRKEVIKLIPGILYANPQSHLQTMKDAFDLTVQAVLDRVTDFRIRMIEGRQIEDPRGSDDLKAEKVRVSVTTRHWEGKRWKREQEGAHFVKNTASDGVTKALKENYKGVIFRLLKVSGRKICWRKKHRDKRIL